MNNIILIPYLIKYNELIKEYLTKITNTKVITYNNFQLENILYNKIFIKKDTKIHIIIINNKSNAQIKKQIFSINNQINYIEINQSKLKSIINIYKNIKEINKQEINNQVNIINFIYSIIKLSFAIMILDNYENYLTKNNQITKNNLEFKYKNVQQQIINSQFKLKNLYKINRNLQKNKRNSKEINTINAKENKQILLLYESYEILTNINSIQIEKIIYNNNIQIKHPINVKNIKLSKLLNIIVNINQKIKINILKKHLNKNTIFKKYIINNNKKGIIYLKEYKQPILKKETINFCTQNNIPLLEININQYNIQEKNKLNIFVSLIKYQKK